MTLRIMLDLETMSLKSNAAIVSIGACANDGRPDLSLNVYLTSSAAAGLNVDPDTMLWWIKAGKEVQKALIHETRTLEEALTSFSDWLGTNLEDPSKGVECELWAKPAAFDVVILGSAYAALGKRVPWHYRAPRCLRTALALAPHIDSMQPESDFKHTALNDAKYQMGQLEQVLKHLNIE